MARVFDAFDERLERPVALKILRPQTLALPGMRTRFQREARIAAQLTHPNIVAILDFGEDRFASYLVMERLPGTTLRDEIVGGPLTSERVMLVLSETLSALSAAHRFGVVHRDVKPSNILLQEDGHAKITDFGIAKTFEVGVDPGRLGDDLTLTGVVLGTPGYLAPERRSGLPATVQSDLYSVGAVMVEALSGRRPAPWDHGNEHLPQPFRDVVLGAMAAHPDDRFRSAAEMLQALRTRPPVRGVGDTPAGNPAACTDRNHVTRQAPTGVSRHRNPFLAAPHAAEGRPLAPTTAPSPPRRGWHGDAGRDSVLLAGQLEPAHRTGCRWVRAPHATRPRAGHRSRAGRDQKSRDGPR